jgi:uncharacterized protein
MTYLILAVLAAYKALVRPALPPLCRFHPSCSDYAAEAVRRRGARGLLLAARRLSRCHPFNAGGHDPVPTING